MLSSQTKDTVNFATMAKLRSLEGGLTPQVFFAHPTISPICRTPLFPCLTF